MEDNGVVIAICGGYQLLGNYYKTDQGMIEGLKLVDMSTEQGKGRLIGNIVMQSDLFDMPIVGLKIMEGVPPSETTDPWERFCQDTEMTDNPVRKGLYTKM